MVQLFPKATYNAWDNYIVDEKKIVRSDHVVKSQSCFETGVSYIDMIASSLVQRLSDELSCYILL